jgi:hypothetical protein
MPIDASSFQLVPNAQPLSNALGGLIQQQIAERLGQKAMGTGAEADQAYADLAVKDPRAAAAIGDILQNRQQRALLDQQRQQQLAQQKGELSYRVARGFQTANDKAGYLQSAAQSLAQAGHTDLAQHVAQDAQDYANSPALIESQYNQGFGALNALYGDPTQKIQQSKVGELIAERNKLAADDPNRKVYDAAIAKESQTSNADNFKVVGKRLVDTSSGKPIDVTPQSAISGNSPDNADLDAEDLKFMAQQYLAGDTSVLQNLGRGVQGSRNVVLLRKAIRSQAEGLGMNPKEVAQAMAEFQGSKAAQRALGPRSAQSDLAVTEFQKVLPLALAASDAVPRTNWVPVNKALEFYRTQTGSPEQRKFGAALNTVVNVYSRAVSPTGQPTVSDKEHARDILSTADSPEAFRQVTDLLMKEAQAARSAPAEVKRDLREQATGRPAPGEGAPTTPAALPPTNAQGWTLHIDKQGNRAYVSPDGKQYQEVR